MDNALATTAPNAIVPADAAPAAPTLASRWRELPPRQQTMGVVGIAALLAVLVALAFSAKDSDYRTLAAELTDKQGGAITTQLEQMGVPYKVTAGGTAIQVPSSQVNALRMKLGGLGLELGGVEKPKGYELLDQSSFGQTQGHEQMTFKRVTEGELARLIQSTVGVKTAVVQLGLPPQNGFFREQQKPTASVRLTLHPGYVLDRRQVAGMVDSVAKAVPNLSPKDVTISDQHGAALNPGGENDQGLNDKQLQYRQELEAQYLKRVIELLEPVVGRDNLRATVTADIDFSRVRQIAEAHRPNQGPDAQVTVREQRTEESSQPTQPAATGTPGAASNVPPTPPTAPINGPAQQLQGAGGVAGAPSTRREAATRFEVDTTTTETINAVGQIRRLNVAVVVNHRTTPDAKGKPVTAALPDKEIEQLTALVQQGVGFNSERGDTVKVINAPFITEKPPVGEEGPLWKQPWVIDLLKTAAAPGALALVALAIIFTLIRPAMKTLLAPPPKPEEPEPEKLVDEVVADEPSPEDAEKLLLEQTQLTRLESARAMARNNPAAVAHIVRGWVNGEEPAVGG